VSTATRVIAAAVAAGAAYLLWGWLTVSPEDRVRSAIDELTTVMSTRATDPLGQVAALGQLRQRLAEDIVVTTGGGADLRGRDAVAGLWQRVRASGNGVRVRAVDVTVIIGEDRASATAEGVAELTVERGGTPERELRDVQVGLIERDGNWLVSRAVLIEPVTPPR
jgi:ketosteroid isomerase-like protein